ncbi:hypothetical protein A2160_05730 [Candidatus Beckwithbacteria bacterium RBG_13_42_9]|uniref:2'-deoxynucleoside 5'-phosphate N-hydrolase 1 n=1 Tax=Candidatus Beckwithbacteria bacterium RBG_13_42_9 TaxID=1797457 RepID=A0A1F5E626_9BACT|nr:MAG: hypothetical protein A2160_05730 [Candidatus Beckwithbacteria bacterium RBG_13_42_9]
MKIYFTAAISAINEFGENYRRIVSILGKEGYSVQADHVLNAEMINILTEPDQKKIEYYKKFLKWVNTADIVVAEASFPSTVHIGHEISMALAKGKPVIVLYVKGKAPIFLQGLVSDKLHVVEYSLDDLPTTLKDIIEDAKEEIDVRFNFFVSPRIVTYLDWVVKKKKMPRAVYLRRLIEQDMDKNKEFLKE